MILTLLFLIRGDKVLLAMKKRGHGVGLWNGIGGKIHDDESLEEALVRETIEEIGVTPVDYEQAAEIDFDEIVFGKHENNKVYVYRCRSWAGEPTESEEMAPKWFKIEHLPLEKMWDDDKYWLPQVLDGKLLKCRFKLNPKDEIVEKNVLEVSKFDS